MTTDVIEGEVVVQPTYRRRERTLERAIVRLADAPVEDQVERLRPLGGWDQSRAVTAMLSHARAGLLTAIAAQSLPGIVEFKARAAAVEEIAKQLQLSKDVQLDATEFLRLAEYSLAAAIRQGQSRGEISSHGLRTSYGNRHGCIARQNGVSVLSSPYDFAGKQEINPGSGGTSIYRLADDVSGESFKQALATARAEGNLSRANVARKVSSLIIVSDPPEPIPEPRKVRKTAAARKVMEDLIVTVNSLVFIVNDTDPAEVDGPNHADDIAGIWEGTNVIRKFLKLIDQEGS